MTVPGRLIACILLAGLAACTDAIGASDPKAAIARGEQALRDGRPRTARIEFLNAIKADPDDARLRLLQAETYLELGDAVAAEAEIRRARQIGVTVGQTRHLLAHAYLLQARDLDAVAEARAAPPEHRGYAARIAGQAQAKLGDTAAASDSFDAAIEAAPSDPTLWTDVARFRRSIGDMAGALAAADRAVRLQPNHVDALTLRGELTRNQYGLAAALPWFDRALEADETHVAARLERAATLGDMGQAQEMLAETRRVLKDVPGQPMAYYLQAMIAARAGQFALARSLHQKTGGAMDDQPAGMLLAGAIEYQTGATEQAVSRLEKLVAMQPDNDEARHLLAAANWRRGNVDATIQALTPIADRPDADSYALALLAEAYAKRGDRRRASALLTRVAQPRPSEPALLRAGLSDGRIEALRDTAESEPQDVRSQIALIGALLARGQNGEALNRARALQARHPGAADAHVLVGDALGIQADFAGAAQQYRKAANLHFAEPVAMRLIEALRRSGQAPAAARVLALFLEQNPRNVSALLLAANGFMEMGNWEQAIGIYEGLRRRLGDRDSALLNNLGYAYARQDRFDRAIPLAQKAWSLDTNNPATADTLGWLLFKSGKDRARGLALIEQAARGTPTADQIGARLNRGGGG